MNYIDLLIVLLGIIFILQRAKQGVYIVLANLVTFIASFVIGLKYYKSLSTFIQTQFDILPSFTNVLGFIIAVVVSQIIMDLVIYKALSFIPQHISKSKISKVLAVLPATADVIIIFSAVLLMIIILPISPRLKTVVMDSRIGGTLVSHASKIETHVNTIFGDNVQESLTLLTVRPESNATIEIPYKPTRLSIDYQAEEKMLELINQERAKVGAKPVVIDDEITLVARAHSTDMWNRGYFSHINPDQKDPFDRMEAGNIAFLAAGENLALAPSVELAHIGLMNSPGHRENILNPIFGRVGIGVIDGGIYGKIFTQNFAD